MANFFAASFNMRCMSKWFHSWRCLYSTATTQPNVVASFSTDSVASFLSTSLSLGLLDLLGVNNRRESTTKRE